MRKRLNLREVGRLSMSKLMYKQNEILTLIVLLIKIVTSGYVGETNWWGQRNGEGVWTYSSGSVYSGSWKNGQKHGEGVQTYSWGSVYSGSYDNGWRHGQGVITYASGKQ